MIVVYTKTARQYLDDLIDILYEKHYFGFEESAHNYVDTLMDEVRSTIYKASTESTGYF